MKRFVVLVLAGALAACSAEAEPERESAPVREDDAGEPLVPKPKPAPVDPPAPAPAGPSCGPLPLVSYEVGARCGLWATGKYTCPIAPEVDGFVYACEDEGGAPRRPQIAGCHEWKRTGAGAKSWTFTLCPDAACTKYAIDGCSGTGYACPSDRPGVPTVSPPGTCEPAGAWSLDDVSGPALCCH